MGGALVGSAHSFAMKSRWNSPYINRFLSADTIVPGYTNPQSLNRYSYVNNNPLKYVDPSGHMPDDGCSLGCTYTPPPPATNYCTTHPGACGGGSGTGGGSGSGGSGSLPSIVIPDLPCNGMMTCEQQTPYEYVTSLLPFSSSDTCYFLLHDPVLCNSSSWQNLPNTIVSYANLPYLPPNSANWDLDPAHADYSTASLNLFSVALQITNDRYDQSFVSVGGSTSAIGISYINGSIGNPFDNKIPSWNETQSFLTGPAVNVTGSFFFGVGGTGSPQVLIEHGLNSDIKPYAVEDGIHVTYPSISISGTWGWQLP